MGSRLGSVKERRYGIVPLSLGISLFFLFFIPGCNFDSGGLGQGINPSFGVYCLTAATRFVPTPGAIAGGPPANPALPLGDEDCEKFAENLPKRWEFLRTETPGETPLLATHWDFIDTMVDDGILYCVLNVVVSADDILDVGIGSWQITHEFNNWSVTCDEVRINRCPTEHNAVDIWASHTTFGRDGCVNDLIGIDIVPGPDFP